MSARDHERPHEELRQALHAWDPARSERGLDADERALLRQRMLTAVDDVPSWGAGPGWIAVLAAAAIVATIGLMLSGRTRMPSFDGGGPDQVETRAVSVVSPARIESPEGALELDGLVVPPPPRNPVPELARLAVGGAAPDPPRIARTHGVTRRRQVHFESESGRRIVWTLDSEFPVREELALTGPD